MRCFPPHLWLRMRSGRSAAHTSATAGTNPSRRRWRPAVWVTATGPRAKGTHTNVSDSQLKALCRPHAHKYMRVCVCVCIVGNNRSHLEAVLQADEQRDIDSHFRRRFLSCNVLDNKSEREELVRVSLACVALCLQGAQSGKWVHCMRSVAQTHTHTHTGNGWHVD